MGEHAAYNMLGKFIPYSKVPFFWTRHYNKSLQYVGYANPYDEVHIDGSVLDNKFIAYYISNDKILAVAGQNRGKDMLTMQEAFNQYKVPSASDIKTGKVTLDTLWKSLQTGGGCACKKDRLAKA